MDEEDNFENIDDIEEDDYDEDEDKDEVDEAGVQMNDNFQFPPRQVIGNQFIDSKGRPQSAKVQNNIGGGLRGFKGQGPDGGNAQYPVQAYQYNPSGNQGNSYNYPSDALNMIRNYSG